MILALRKARIRREPNLGCRGGWQTWVNMMLCQKSLHESCTMGRRLVVVKLICSLSHCECDGHTVHKLIQRRLTADWLAPREIDCSLMHSKVFSDWLPSYIKATQPVLEVFKMAEYFPDRPRIYLSDHGTLSVFILRTAQERRHFVTSKNYITAWNKLYERLQKIISQKLEGTQKLTLLEGKFLTVCSIMQK